MNNLLVLTTRYNHKNDQMGATFINDQVDQLKLSYDKVLVIAFRPYMPKIFSFFFKPDRRRDSLAENYSYENVQVIYVKNFIIPFSIFRYSWSKKGFASAKKILKKYSFNPSIIHAHRTWPIGEIAYYLSKLLNIKYFVTAHGYDAYGLHSKSNFYKSRIKISLLNAAKVICVSKKNIDILSRSMGIPKEKFCSIPNGYDKNKFFPINTRNSKENNKIKFLSVGFLHKIKGHSILIKAFKQVYRVYNNAELSIVGDGPEKKKLESLINKNNLKNCIQLVGSIPHGKISNWINSCDFFVLPSLNEGMPTVMLEALGCGKPIIATEVGGIPEILNDKLGILVSKDDKISLSDGLLAAIDRKWDSEYISNYSKDFSWQVISKKILKLYKKNG